MTRFWTAMAVTFFALFAVVGCNDYGNTFQNPTGAFLSSLSPSNLPAGGQSFTLQLNGSGFVAKTKVQWNGTTCPTSSTSGAQCTTTVTLDVNNNVTSVTATISASLIAKPGLATVQTVNPASGTGNNGLSNPLNFIINNPPNPVPTVSSVSPTCAVTGGGLALTVTGTNFLNGSATANPPQVSTLIWTLGPSQLQITAPTATITSTQITATIPATSVNMAGSATIAVSNPPSLPLANVAGSTGTGGGTSTSATSVSVQSSACPTAARAQANSSSTATVAEETPAVSLDGRYVAYTALQDERAQIFFRDTCEVAPTGCQPHTSLLSVTSDADPAAGNSQTPSMSSDGRYVAFSSDAANLVENAPPGRQVYLRDTCVGAPESCRPTTILISTDSRGALLGAESLLPSVSSSGRFVAFLAVTPSHAPLHSSGEAKSSADAVNSGYRQVFVRDTCLGADNCTPRTTRISLQPGDGAGTDGKPAGPALSGKAKHIAMNGAKASTLFTPSVPVDDSVFLAITSDQR